MLPNIPPKLFSISAVAIGYLLIDDTTALFAWCTLCLRHAFYRALMQERGLEPRESTESGKNNSYSFGNNSNYFNNNFNGKTDSQTEYNETIIMLEKMIRALEKEICEIKKKMN